MSSREHTALAVLVALLWPIAVASGCAGPGASPTADPAGGPATTGGSEGWVPTPIGGPLAAIEGVTATESVTLSEGLSATSALSPTEPITFTGIPLETIAALGNLTYTVSRDEGRTYLLSDGTYDDLVSRTSVAMFPPAAIGDLDGDGDDDAGVLVAEHTGGTGQFVYLAAILGADGTWSNVDTVLLGDRVRVTGMSIVDGAVNLDVIAHGPADAMCCPTVPQTWQYALVGDRLSLVSDVGPANVAR